jgi:hypothetical protein
MVDALPGWSMPSWRADRQPGAEPASAAINVEVPVDAAFPAGNAPLPAIDPQSAALIARRAGLVVNQARATTARCDSDFRTWCSS